jgi:SAM-dependent methyltransferase
MQGNGSACLGEYAAESRATTRDRQSDTPAEIPEYLQKYYWWAYLHPVALSVFDWYPVVSAILWGNYRRLMAAVLDEVKPGQRVMQLAAVYGPFSRHLVAALGETGTLDLLEVAPIQVERARLKLAGYPNVQVIRADAATVPTESDYDRVISFFLLHEVPEDCKARIVEGALARVKPGGRVIFIDYHEPARWHPLRPLMAIVFKFLEPFARVMWDREIVSYASESPVKATWSKTTFFGGLYQKVVAERCP